MGWTDAGVSSGTVSMLLETVREGQARMKKMQQQMDDMLAELRALREAQYQRQGPLYQDRQTEPSLARAKSM